MNLRILKKLSKRAAPLLPLLGDTRKQYPAEKEGSDTSVSNIDFKHLDRWQAKHPDGRWRKYMPKHGKHWIVFAPAQPFKGTIMVGAMSGYYEPEWSEETAWESLRSLVYWHFVEWTEDGPLPLRRDLSTPRLIFKAAQEMVAGSAKNGEAGS